MSNNWTASSVSNKSGNVDCRHLSEVDSGEARCRGLVGDLSGTCLGDLSGTCLGDFLTEVSDHAPRGSGQQNCGFQGVCLAAVTPIVV